MESFVSLKVAAEKKIHGDGVSKVTSFAVDPRLLEVEEGFNARPLNKEHVAEMSLAYRNRATFPPVDVRVEDGHIILVDGHHRRAAALDAIEKGAEVRALECRQFRGSDADRVAHMITSAGGLPLTPLQLGLQYRKLIHFGWKEKAVADRVGKTIQHVKDMVLLAEANSDVHHAINAGEISGSLAVTVVKQHGTKAGNVIREGLAEEQASGKARAKVTAKTLARRSAPKGPSDKEMLDWLFAEHRPSGFPNEDGSALWTIRFTAPAGAPQKGSELRAVVAAAMAISAGSTITPTT